MSRCKLLSATIAAAFAAMPAFAGDLDPPPWPRTDTAGQPLPNITTQCWTFQTPFNPAPPDPGFWNPHGQPSGPRVLPGGPIPPEWLPEFGGRFGVWCLNPGDMLEFDIPNWYMPQPHQKDIWIQIKFLAGPPIVDVLFPPTMGGGLPLASVPAGPPIIEHPIDPVGSGWTQGVWAITLPFCPDFEVIKITAPTTMYIDQICIDTRCEIPAPGAAALLGMAGLLAARRRRD